MGVREGLRAVLGALIVLSLARAAGAMPAATLPAAAPSPADVFDELQQNVWYLPTADRQARLYVTSIGHGPTVVVLHGGPGNDFNYLVDALRPLAGQYRFVLFDQRGSLLSPVDAAKLSSLTMTELVDDVETLREALGQSRIVLFGHSFGSLLAEFYFKAYPQHVARLILAGAMPPSTASGTLAQLIGEMHRRQDALRDRASVTAAKRAAGVLGKPARLSPQHAMMLFKIENASLNFYHVERWPQFQGGGVYYDAAVDDAIGNSLPSGYDMLSVLRAHPVAVSIIQGDHDYVDPAASSWVKEAKGLANVHVYVIKSAGHYSWVDDPTSFDDDLRSALTSASVVGRGAPGRLAPAAPFGP